jgi:hypothetical protein
MIKNVTLELIEIVITMLDINDTQCLPAIVSNKHATPD